MLKVALCTPSYFGLHDETAKAIDAGGRALAEAGFKVWALREIGNPYISRARAELVRKALDGGADFIVFIDHDMSFPAADLVKLVNTYGDVVAGTYRYKKDAEEYMGTLRRDAQGRPVKRIDSALAATGVPAGFLKISAHAVERFTKQFPHLKFGDPKKPHIDLFNHGARGGEWVGEDIGFCRNWIEGCGGEIWVMPHLNIDHWSGDKCYAGNLHRFLSQGPY